MTRYLLLVLPKLPRVPWWIIQRGLQYVTQARVYFHDRQDHCASECAYCNQNGAPALMLEVSDPLPEIQRTQENVYQEWLRQRDELNKLVIWLRSCPWPVPTHTMQSPVDIVIYHLNRLAAEEKARQGAKP